jgi:FeS assembly protein IscX
VKNGTLGTRQVAGQLTELYWDSTYAIVVALMENYPDQRPIDIGLEQLMTLVITLPGFEDDPDLVTDRILYDILTTWYEEST